MLVEQLSICGNFCLWNEKGVAAEKSATKDAWYQANLPLTDDNCERFVECGVAKILLQGVVGKVLNESK